jgi:hypothetical protein
VEPNGAAIDATAGTLVGDTPCGGRGTNAGANATDSAADASDPIVDFCCRFLLASWEPSYYAACANRAVR